MDDKIWIAAKMLLVRFGADAAGMAKKRADQLRTEGEIEEAETMMQIVAAIAALERTERGDEDALH